MLAPALRFYYQNTAGELLEHPDGYAVVRYQATKHAPADLRALLVNLGQLLLRRGWSRYLSDARLMPPLSPDEKLMSRDDWYGGLIQRPAVVRVAVVAAINAISRLGIAEVVQQAGNGISYRNFADEASAHTYLQALPTA